MLWLIDGAGLVGLSPRDGSTVANADTLGKSNPKLAKLLPHGFMPEFQRFYFDVAQIAMPGPLFALKEVAPVVFCWVGAPGAGAPVPGGHAQGR